MGDFRITIEAVGGHGCGRGTESPLPTATGDPVLSGGSLAERLHVTRCRSHGCPDCRTIEFVEGLKRNGCSVAKATIEHWPVPGAAGTTRTEAPGPIDNLIEGTRDRKWS
jgi:hypothetical protein